MQGSSKLRLRGRGNLLERIIFSDGLGIKRTNIRRYHEPVAAHNWNGIFAHALNEAVAVFSAQEACTMTAQDPARCSSARLSGATNRERVG